jgi:hypothetical protein
MHCLWVHSVLHRAPCAMHYWHITLCARHHAPCTMHPPGLGYDVLDRLYTAHLSLCTTTKSPPGMRYSCGHHVQCCTLMDNCSCMCTGCIFPFFSFAHFLFLVNPNQWARPFVACLLEFWVSLHTSMRHQAPKCLGIVASFRHPVLVHDWLSLFLQSHIQASSQPETAQHRELGKLSRSVLHLKLKTIAQGAHLLALGHCLTISHVDALDAFLKGLHVAPASLSHTIRQDNSIFVAWSKVRDATKVKNKKYIWKLIYIHIKVDWYWLIKFWSFSEASVPRELSSSASVCGKGLKGILTFLDILCQLLYWMQLSWILID